MKILDGAVVIVALVIAAATVLLALGDAVPTWLPALALVALTGKLSLAVPGQGSSTSTGSRAPTATPTG